MSPRVIAIGLDGFEATVAAAMMAEGRLPMFRRLAREAATFRLDHGPARDTGLAWEHFATGKAPDAYRRWSAVRFDPATYAVRQDTTRAAPFLTAVAAPVVAFDVPYLDLAAAGAVQGMANWGAHDPGVRRHAQPAALAGEIAARFGPYPAARYIYGFVWPSAEQTETMGRALAEAMRQRTQITSWLLRERLPDWRLALTVVAELHSAAEALWHGFEPAHPLHGHPSAPAARRGLEAVYVETDAMVARLAAEHPDAALAVFAMHGMGPNRADLASMVLLPELMHRRAFGRPFLHPRRDWALPLPMLRPGENWSPAVGRRLGTRDPDSLAARLGRAFGRKPPADASGLDWMPAARYRRFWPRMPAFALPAYYDGQVRLNLRGRESAGLVDPADYGRALDALEAELAALTDPVSGKALVRDIARPLAADPMAETETRCDLKISWAQSTYAFASPAHGLIGPVPQRRTGGHTGAHGWAAFLGAGLAPGAHGTRSAFDMVPTLLDLIGAAHPAGLSGHSLCVPQPA